MMTAMMAVLANVKVRNLKANHSWNEGNKYNTPAVLANVKVRNLKANHSHWAILVRDPSAVLANVKVRNLKANHSVNGLCHKRVVLY